MPSKSKKVLVVDDEPAVRATLSNVLEKAGYTVESAANGQAGLRILERGPLPDLIVLDLVMPVMTGFEVIDLLRLHSSWASIPVIVLTGTDGYTAKMLQVDSLLKKPFNLTDVQAAIHLAVASKRSRGKP